jgi:hypothetical protein
MDPEVTLANRFPSELGVHGTMRLPNRKEELARTKSTLIARSRVWDLKNGGGFRSEFVHGPIIQWD